MDNSSCAESVAKDKNFKINLEYFLSYNIDILGILNNQIPSFIHALHTNSYYYSLIYSVLLLSEWRTGSSATKAEKYKNKHQRQWQTSPTFARFSLWIKASAKNGATVLFLSGFGGRKRCAVSIFVYVKCKSNTNAEIWFGKCENWKREIRDNNVYEMCNK